MYEHKAKKENDSSIEVANNSPKDLEVQQSQDDLANSEAQKQGKEGSTTTADTGNPSTDQLIRWFNNLVALQKLYEETKHTHYNDTNNICKTLDRLERRYKNVTEKKVRQDDVDKLFEYIENEIPTKFIAEPPYISEQEIKNIFYFYYNNNINSLETVLNDAQACMARYELSYQWSMDINSINELKKHFSDVIYPNRAALLTKQEDLEYINIWRNEVQGFLDAFNNSEDAILKEYFQDRYDEQERYPSFIAGHKTELEKALVLADKRREKQKELEALSEKEQIESNPDLVNGDAKAKYIEKDETNPEEADKKNQNFLKIQGIYHEKEGYRMYKQGPNGEDEVNINAVIQGTLGNCPLLAAMAAVARANPSLIKNIISFESGDDFATVSLYIKKADGTRTKKEVKVDFYFPVHIFLNEFAYAKGGDGELWVMVIEKAYAKEMGGYDNIHFGIDTVEAFAVLTGKEATRVKMTNDEEALGQALENALGKDKAAVTGTKEQDKIQSQEKYKIASMNPDKSNEGYYVILPKGDYLLCNHAYTITSVDKHKKTLRLRNPHGKNAVERTVKLLVDGAPKVVTQHYITGAELTITFEDFRNCFVDFCVADLNQE